MTATKKRKTSTSTLTPDHDFKFPRIIYNTLNEVYLLYNYLVLFINLYLVLWAEI